MRPMVSTKDRAASRARHAGAAVRAALDQHAEDEQHDRRSRHAGEERQAERAHEVHGVGAEHEELAVGEIDHAENAEDQGQADAHERVHRATHQPLEDQLRQDRRVGEQAESITATRG